MGAVAQFLGLKFNLPQEDIFTSLLTELDEDRSRVFDRYLEKIGRYSKRLVALCLAIYRRHTPSIRLYPQAEECLSRFGDYPIYVVTDGNKLVQKSKCSALGLQTRVKRCLYTHAHGRERSKPSPHCFLRICRLEGVPPSQVVYIADNPAKDFVGIKPLGFHTIRVLTGRHRDLVANADLEAEVVIGDLSELTPCLLERLLESRL